MKIKLFFLFAVLSALILVSCNVTRTITTQQQVVQHGDTITTMTTKTIESYNATKQ